MGKAKKTAGVVRGRLIGGNMTVFTSLLGTSWQENLSGCVLLLEDGMRSVSYLECNTAQDRKILEDYPC